LFFPFGFAVSLKIHVVLLLIFIFRVLILVSNLASKLLKLAYMEFRLDFSHTISVLPTGVKCLRLQKYTVLLNVRMGVFKVIAVLNL